MDLLLTLLVIIFFLLLKGFFSGSEIAVVNSDKIKLRHQAKVGDRGANMVLKLFRTPDLILGTTLVGTNIATVIITTLGTLIFIDLFGPSGDIISVLILTPFLLIFGEVVPKSVFQQKADTIVTKVIHALRFFSFLFYPVVVIFGRVARLITRMVGGSSASQTPFITREELHVLLDLSESSTNLSTIDRRKIKRIIRFGDTTVGEAMIPLADVVGLNENRNIEEAVRIVLKHGFNRLPLYEGNITNVKGVLTLSTWDLLDPDITSTSCSDHTDTALYITPKQTIDRALPLLQAREDHMAIVVNEFGSAIGILTMEDVFEEVVGEIDVGYDFDEYQPRRRIFIEHESEDSHIMGGRTPISEVNDVLHINLPVGEAHTVGGFVANKLLRIPKSGDSITEAGYQFTVLEADARAVIQVRLNRL